MTCCTLKVLTYTSASLQLAFFALVLSASILGIVAGYVGSKLVESIFFLSIAISYVIILIIVLVGVKQNRIRLVHIYLCADHAIVVIGLIWIVYDLIHGITHKKKKSSILTSVFVELAVVVVEIILTTPIQKFYKRMQQNSLDVKQSTEKETSKDLCKNLEINISATDGESA